MCSNSDVRHLLVARTKASLLKFSSEKKNRTVFQILTNQPYSNRVLKMIQIQTGLQNCWVETALLYLNLSIPDACPEHLHFNFFKMELSKLPIHLTIAAFPVSPWL